MYIPGYTLRGKDRMLISSKAYSLRPLLYAVAIIQLFSTFMIPVGPYSNPIEVYLRNGTSVLALSMVAYYFGKWSDFNASSSSFNYSMKFFKILTLLTALACFFKVVVATYYSVNYITVGSFVSVYYIGETLAWLGLGVFFIVYFVKLCSQSSDE